MPPTPRSGGDRESFRGNSSKKSILFIVRTFWIVREVESYATSKFQPPTTLGDHQNVEQIRFWSSFERPGTSGKSRGTRCQNSSLLRPLATTKTSKKRFGKKIDFFGFRKSVFRHFSLILEGIDIFKRQNRLPREILLQIHLF